MADPSPAPATERTDPSTSTSAAPRGPGDDEQPLRATAAESSAHTDTLPDSEVPSPATLTVLATRYTVAALPETHPDFRHYAIDVLRRGPDQWVVCLDDRFLSRDGRWDYRCTGDDDIELWRAEHWFDLDTALRLAAQVAPQVVVGDGHTVADALAHPGRG